MSQLLLHAIEEVTSSRDCFFVCNASLTTKLSFSITSELAVGWISALANFISTGYLHVASIAISVIWLAAAAHRSRHIKLVHSSKAIRTLKRYELPSHVARCATLAFAILAAVRDAPELWYTVALTGLAVLLGLTRITNNLKWRHLALHQVNFLNFMSLLLLAAGQLLPILDLHTSYRPTDAVVETLVSMSVTGLIALCTPREWAPPAADLDISQRPADAGPAPEETCSWGNLYLTFEWLTPLIWKGCRGPVEMDDLPPLPWYDEPLLLLSRVQEARAKSKSTFWTCMRFMRTEIFFMVLFTAITFSVDNVQPYAMYRILAYINKPEEANLSPVLWLILLFAGPMTKTVAFQQYIFTSTSKYSLPGSYGSSLEECPRAVVLEEHQRRKIRFCIDSESTCRTKYSLRFV